MGITFYLHTVDCEVNGQYKNTFSQCFLSHWKCGGGSKNKTYRSTKDQKGDYQKFAIYA